MLSIRFRRAWVVQGHHVDELPFKAMFGVWGSWAGLFLIVLVLIAQFYVYVQLSYVGKLSLIHSSGLFLLSVEELMQR